MNDNDLKKAHESAFEIAKAMHADVLSLISSLALLSNDPAIIILRTVAELVAKGKPEILIQKDLTTLLNLWKQIVSSPGPSSSYWTEQPVDRTGC